VGTCCGWPEASGQNFLTQHIKTLVETYSKCQATCYSAHRSLRTSLCQGSSAVGSSQSLDGTLCHRVCGGIAALEGACGRSPTNFPAFKHNA
jgi:hypothetical protein